MAESSEISYEEAVKTVERWNKEGATEEEKIQYLEEAIKALDDPEKIELFKSAMEELGIRAVKTDDAFSLVMKAINSFVKEYGDIPEFKDLKEIYQPDWKKYQTTWQGYINTSRDLATKTAAEYQDYTLYLQSAGEIKTMEEVKQLALDYTEFAKNKPVGISVEFANNFLELRRLVEDFQKRFNNWIKTTGQELEHEAEAIQTIIEGLKEELAKLNKQVKDATLGLEIASWWGPVGAIAAGTALAVITKKRNDKQKELDKAEDDLQKVVDKQTALAAIKAQFEALVPSFLTLSQNLNLFADTWNSFHNQAEAFAVKFNALKTPHLPLLFKKQVDAALKVSIPLVEGLKAYASKIHI